MAKAYLGAGRGQGALPRGNGQEEPLSFMTPPQCRMTIGLMATRSGLGPFRDPRSPTVGVSRTPIQLDKDDEEGDSATSRRRRRKNLLVNKPQPPTPSAVQGSSGVNNKVAPGTVQVQIQPDGGSTVSVNSAVVKTVVAKPPVKRRAPARKRQAAECITLSSDDEDPPEPPKKVSKPPESKPPETTASSLVAAAASAAKSVTATPANASTSTAPNSSSQATANPKEAGATATPEKPGESAVVKEGEAATAGMKSSQSSAAGAKPKALKINLNLDASSQEREEKVKDPLEVYNDIDKALGSIGRKFEYVTLSGRSIRVGSYKVTTNEVPTLPITLTSLGLKFCIPAANYKNRTVKVSIPMDCIYEMKACFSKRLPVLLITTGPKYAGWIRTALALDGSPTNDTSNYYCPQNGGSCQRTITLLFDNVEEADVGTIKKLYEKVIHELDGTKANDFLMKITPQSYRSSIGMPSSPSPPAPPSSASGGDTASGPKIVSTTSMSRVALPSPPSSTLSTASTVLLPSSRSEASPPVDPGNSVAVQQTNAATTEAAANDHETILLYKGKNNLRVPICPLDIRCLGHSQFLNDQIIDFWMAVICSEMLSEEDRNRTFVFDSFFYSKLTEKMKRKAEEDGNMTAGERRHNRVKKRTKNVDIFSKDFLIVPINENFHWFIAIICFPGQEGFCDYNTGEPLPNYKRPRMTASKSASSAAANNKKKPIVYNQPKNDSTAALGDRDEAPEDPDEVDQASSLEEAATPDATTESKSQAKTEPATDESNSQTGDKKPATPSTSSGGAKRKADEISQRTVKHPCILVFDSLAGEARAKIYATLREYLKIEYKTKKNKDRVFDKNTMPGIMPKVPQQPNFSDCGLYMLQYVESFFNNPISSYDFKDMNLKQWFDVSVANNKREEIYDFIKDKIKENSPENLCRVPVVSFVEDPSDDNNPHDPHSQSYDDEEFDDDYMMDEEDEYEDTEDDNMSLPSVGSSPSPGGRRPRTRRASSQQPNHNNTAGGSDSDDICLLQPVIPLQRIPKTDDGEWRDGQDLSDCS